MDQQTPDRGWQELRATIGGILDHILNQEKETAILNASRMERPAEKSYIGYTEKVKAL